MYFCEEKYLKTKKNMKSKLTRIGKPLSLVLMLLGLSACDKQSEENEGGNKATSMLQIYTRASDASDPTVSYPVNVYVFKGDQCEATQTINDANEALSLPLSEGDYTVYAIGGASTTNYTLPSQENATKNTIITRKEGKKHGDLMTATSNVTITKEGTNSTTLTMTRKTMLLQSIAMHNIPADATAVSVTIAPLRENIAIDATYSGESGRETTALTKQDDGTTWFFEGEKYLLPPPPETSVTITMSVTLPGGTNNYIYELEESLSAGYKLNIEGTYTEAAAIRLTGTIVGATWEGVKNVSFDFKESDRVTDSEGNSDEADDNSEDSGVTTFTETALPAVGSTYKTCFVLSVNSDVTPAEVVLLSPKEEVLGGTTQNDNMARLEGALGRCAVTGIEGWRLMTRSEIKSLFDIRANVVPSLNSDSRYLFDEDGTMKAAKMKLNFSPAQSLTNTDILRPVATIKINIE